MFTFLPKSVAGQLEIVNMVMQIADLNADAEFEYNGVELTESVPTMAFLSSPTRCSASSPSWARPSC